ncbi:MAG: SIMPL domain-containing protein [Rickettsiales endosymbiont of Dermacentor nuttalli]
MKLDTITENKNNVLALTVLGILIAIGLTMLGYLIGQGLFKVKQLDRIVTVKGLSEKVVDADYVIWPITIKGVDNNLQQINAKIEQDCQKVKEYLIQFGFQNEEIELSQYSVKDLMAQEYRNPDLQKGRYIITASVTLKSNNVKLVKEAYKQIMSLIKEGILIDVGDDYNYKGPLYQFTKFNELKLLMLTEAIENSREAANKFAQDSKSKLGMIKKANQGMFSIVPMNNNEISPNSNRDEMVGIQKKIRVVITVDYYLN